VRDRPRFLSDLGMSLDDDGMLSQEAKYANLSDEELPMTESLACVVRRYSYVKIIRAIIVESE
jgi:hypothetical protein